MLCHAICSGRMPPFHPTARCADLSLDLPSAPPGTAQGGYQADSTQIRAQWEGFYDADSGVGRCEVRHTPLTFTATMQPYTHLSQYKVLVHTLVGAKGLGDECGCTSAFKYEPFCDCAKEGSLFSSPPLLCEPITNAVADYIESKGAAGITRTLPLAAELRAYVADFWILASPRIAERLDFPVSFFISACRVPLCLHT